METREQNVPLNQTSETDVSSPPVSSSTGDGSSWTPSPPLTKSVIRITPSKQVENPFIDSHADSPVAVAAPAASAVPTPRRKPILQEDPPSPVEAAPRQPTSYIVSAPKVTNQRRNPHVLRFIGLLFLVNFLILAAAGTWFYNTVMAQVEGRLSGRGGLAQTGSVFNAQSPSANNTDSGEVTDLKDTIADLQAQIQAAQKRLDTSEQNTQNLAARVQEQAGTKTLPNQTTAESPLAPVGNTSESDLILLKERNRLMAYADEAIATGARAPYDKLWEALEDKRLSNLIFAARTEILRVQNYYLSGSRLESFDIPVGDYFPDSANLRDSQLGDDKLIELLQNQENPWQVRLKAANLLGLRRSTVVGDALVKTIKSDGNLDVVKEATFSFEQITGYRAKLFEATDLEAWWMQYNAAPSPQPPAPKKNSAPPAPAPAPTPAPPVEEVKKPVKAEEKPAAKEADKPAAKPEEAPKKDKPADEGTQPQLKLPELRIPEENPAP